MKPRRYVWLVLALCAAFLVPAGALNLLLAANSVLVDKNRPASDWQQATRGVTYAPPINYNRPFKTLRLNDRIAEIDTLVFGSSTTMGVPADAFPPPRRAYNFAQSGNGLPAVIAEAEYVIERWGGKVNLIVIPLDWSLGFVFQDGEPPRAELTPEAALAEGRARPALATVLADALSAPRLRILAGVARDVARAPDPATAFRQVFLDTAGPEYRCPDGTPARDFDVVHRGLCNGFRYDGSATFADQKRLDAGRAPAVLAAAVSGGSQYAAALRGRAGPDARLLARLAQLASRARARGVEVLALLPPLAPGVEDGLARSGHSGASLRATRLALEQWSAAAQVTLLDAGRSERYGCLAAEFVDPHHALPACYRRIFSRHFAGAASR